MKKVIMILAVLLLQVFIVSATADIEAKFAIDGELTDALEVGESDTLSDGSVISLVFISEYTPREVKASIDGELTVALQTGEKDVLSDEREITLVYVTEATSGSTGGSLPALETYQYAFNSGDSEEVEIHARGDDEYMLRTEYKALDIAEVSRDGTGLMVGEDLPGAGKLIKSMIVTIERDAKYFGDGRGSQKIAVEIFEGNYQEIDVEFAKYSRGGNTVSLNFKRDGEYLVAYVDGTEILIFDPGDEPREITIKHEAEDIQILCPPVPLYPETPIHDGCEIEKKYDDNGCIVGYDVDCDDQDYIECSFAKECPIIYCVKEPCPQYVCEDGRCKMPNNVVGECYDSDGGRDYYTRGEVKGLEAPGVYDHWTDYCSWSKVYDDGTEVAYSNEYGKLVEYVCNDKGYGEKVLYKCPEGCEDGRCVGEGQACTLEYDPVCGEKKYHCNAPPGADCIALEGEMKTYSNKCFLEADDAEFLYWGECDGVKPCPEDCECDQYGNAVDCRDGPVCGNGICEEGERTYCEPYDCKEGEPCPAMAGPCYQGTCEKDCRDDRTCKSYYEDNCKITVCETSNGEVSVAKDCDGVVNPPTDCQGCMKDGRCLDYGIRTRNGEPIYCEITGEFETQKEEGKSCQNNFECLSNTCLSGACGDLQKQLSDTSAKLEESNNVMEKIIGWFKRIFGG